MLRNRIDAVVTVLAGKMASRRGVASVERTEEGAYTIQFAPDRPVRAETHQLSIVVLNADRPHEAVFADTGGASIKVRIFDLAGRPTDADFQFSAQRI